MDARDELGRSGGSGSGRWFERLAVAQVVVANAVPVVGVWILGWPAERAIFFYWLDGLLAMWGLGVVAVVVTNRDGPLSSVTPGARRWLAWAAVFALALGVLSLPSVIAGAMVMRFLGRGLGEVLRAVLAGPGVWTSLAVVVGSYGWQAVSELRWRPELTLKETGEERANMFIHRILLMGLLVAWIRWDQPSHWALALYVLVVACLFTFAQLFPERYLELIGFRRKAAVANG